MGASETKKRTRVLVNGHDQKFWFPLQTSLMEQGLYEFREDHWAGHDAHNSSTSLELISWADVIISEWALGNAVFFSKNKLDHQKLIVRFHAQELRTDYPFAIDYEKVFCIVFVGPHVMEEAIERFSIPREKCVLVHNFVDPDHYSLSKLGNEEFNLGMIGIVPENKRVDRALDLLESLLVFDSRYSLHIKGPQPFTYEWLWARTKERQFYQRIYERINSSEALRYRVVFDPPGSDVNQWLRKIGFILSLSNSESFHMALAEGMAAGCIPITWSRDGVERIFCENIIFSEVSDAAKFIDITRRSNTSNGVQKQAQEYVRQSFGKDVALKQWAKLIDAPPNVLSVAKSDVKPQFKSVLVVWAIDSWTTFHRREMLEALAENIGDSVALFVIEPGNHYNTLLQKGVCTETELRGFARLEPIQVKRNIFRARVVTSGYPDDVNVSPLLKSAGANYALAAQRVIADFVGDRCKVVHWLYKPDQRRWVGPEQPFIYEVYDEYTMDFSTGAVHPDVAKMEPEVLRTATHVFFTSAPLAERKAQHCVSHSVVGNGVAFSTFEKARVARSSEHKMRRSVGYLGNLSDFFDWNLVFEVCSRLSEVDFFFHGQVEHHRLSRVAPVVEQLIAMPNVFFTGRVTRPVGAAAVNRYDVLIIPFVINEAMHAVNPLKLWEYFATGRPVVSTPMDAIEVEYPLIRFADDVDRWVAEIRDAMAEDEALAARRIKLAEDYSWARLTETHASIVERIIG